MFKFNLYTDAMREQIIAEIRRLAASEGGKPPGSRSFETKTGIRRHEWLGKIWAKWSEALIDAGFDPLEKSQKLDQEEVFTALVVAFRAYGRIPSRAEFDIQKRRQASLPWYQTLVETFGSKQGMLRELRSWAEAQTGYEDILALIPISPDSGSTPSGSAKEGHVYLIKSGAFYKIGRGDELEKRVKQIRTALPDASTLEHSIRTDDPPGIEAYWHKRFAERRANGEWFKLTTSDVAAFKRRKFQ